MELEQCHSNHEKELSPGHLLSHLWDIVFYYWNHISMGTLIRGIVKEKTQWTFWMRGTRKQLCKSHNSTHLFLYAHPMLAESYFSCQGTQWSCNVHTGIYKAMYTLSSISYTVFVYTNQFKSKTKDLYIRRALTNINLIFSSCFDDQRGPW